MKRRDILTSIAPGAVVGSVLASPTLAQSTRDVRIVDITAGSDADFSQNATELAERISQASGGRLRASVQSANGLSALEAYDAVGRGDYQMIHGREDLWVARNPAVQFFCSAPFGLMAEEMIAWIGFEGGQPLWDAMGQEMGVKPFACGSAGASIGGWFAAAPSDSFEGLRLAASGQWLEVLNRLGATGVDIAEVSMVDALSSGDLDGVYHSGTASGQTSGLAAAAAVCVAPGFDAPNTMLSANINLDFWTTLPADLQYVLENACKSQISTVLARANLANAQALKDLRDEGRIAFETLPASLVTSAFEATQDVQAEVASGAPLASEVEASFSTFRDSVQQWTLASDGHYFKSRAQALNL